jgi:hypothetical protein
MVQHALFSIVFPLAVRLGPVETVEFAVAFAARARDAREVGFSLDEEVVAVAAFDPTVVGGAEEGCGEVEIAWGADGAAFAGGGGGGVFVGLFLDFCGGFDAVDGLLGRGWFLEVSAGAFAGRKAAS